MKSIPPIAAGAHRTLTLVLLAGLLASPIALAEAPGAETDPAMMDHGTMDHGAMDHGAMDHGAMDHGAMDHRAMDHSGMDHDGPTPDCHRPATSQATSGESVTLGDLEVPDLALLDQDGQSRRFVSEVLAGRRVAINFVFTTCTTVCPPMGATFGRLQELLGDRLGEEVAMVSVSIDPVVDTPERLAEWSARFGRRDGWTLLTGPKQEVDRLLKALQVFTPDATDHAPTVLLGDPASGRWERAYGLASPNQMLALLDGLSDTSKTPVEAGR